MNDPITEASEIVAAIAGMDPLELDGWHENEYCWFCESDVAATGRGKERGTTHEPDCVWIRARRLSRLPVHPHRVR